MRGAYFALLQVQIELVLTDGHRPDGFNQSVAGIPGVNNQTGLPKGPLGRCFPVEVEENVSIIYPEQERMSNTSLM